MRHRCRGKSLIHLPRCANTLVEVKATVPTASCFLVEWYQCGPVELSADAAAAHLTRAAAADTHQPPAALLMALTVPDDKTYFGIFSGASTDAIIQICQRAGWPPDRISTDIHPWPRPHTA